MPEEISILEDLRIIQVTSSAEATVEDIKGSFDTALKLNREKGLTRVLVDQTRAESFPSTLPSLEFGENLAKTARVLRVAVVPSPGTRQNMRFLETVARNRGGQMRLFDSPDAALAWLTDRPMEPDEGDDEYPGSGIEV